MLPEKIRNLVKDLISKTIEKKALWVKDSSLEDYKLILENGIVIIDTWTDGDNCPNLELKFYNKYGDWLESFSEDFTFDTTEDFSLLSKLYDEARREYYRVEDTLIEISKEINSSVPIGRRENKAEMQGPDDDLPF